MANTSWIARCKAYMKEHGCQLGEAMKALSNKNKGKRGKSFRGGNAVGGVADNAEAFSGAEGMPTTQPQHQQPQQQQQQGTIEKLGGMFEVGAAHNPGGNAQKIMDGGRRKRTQGRRGRKAKKSKSRSRSRSRSRAGRNRHRSRRGGGHGSSLSFSEYN